MAGYRSREKVKYKDSSFFMDSVSVDCRGGREGMGGPGWGWGRERERREVRHQIRKKKRKRKKRAVEKGKKKDKCSMYHIQDILQRKVEAER